jgi:hypothetical protein
MFYRQDPLVEYEFEEIRASIHYDREVGANSGWLALVKTSGNRKRMRVIVALAFFSQWSGNGLMYAILLYDRSVELIQTFLLVHIVRLCAVIFE